MDWKYQVNALVRHSMCEGLWYSMEYNGKWLIIALWKAFKAKINGAGCVQFEWR